MKSLKTEFTSYALLGSGRVARHFEFYLKNLGLPYTTWSRKSGTPAQLSEVVAKSSHVLFAVRDEAIDSLSQPFLKSGKTLVHFSGAIYLPGVHATHPLMTFGAELEDADWYPLIPFVTEEGHTLEKLLPGFPNRSWPIPAAARPLYHALCSLAGNFSFLLWKNIGDEFEKTLGLPRSLLQPFLFQAVMNSAHPTAANFTGPVARGDWETVRRHLNSLHSRPDLLKAYRSYLELAKESGHRVPEALL